MNNRKTAFLAVMLSALSVMGSCGCAPSPETGHDVVPQGQVAFVVTTDYMSGSCSVVGTGDWSTAKNLHGIHQDAVCRYDPVSGRVYIVSRLGADAVEVLDPQSDFDMTCEYSMGSGSNPQDIVVVSQARAYVPLYDRGYLQAVCNPSGETGTPWLDSIDISTFDTGDAVPEAAWAAAAGGTVYVALQRLENLQVPVDYSSVLALDASTGVVLEEIRLHGINPFGKMRYSDVLHRIVIPTTGRFGIFDAGVEYIDPSDNSLSGFVITEAELGGDVNDAVIQSPKKGYAVISVGDAGPSMHTSVVSFNPSTGKKMKVLLVSDGYDYSFCELTPDGGQLWVTDRTPTAPGIRIFDTSTDEQLTGTPIDVGLPPFMICFVP